jgi:hypothetical protein
VRARRRAAKLGAAALVVAAVGGSIPACPVSDLDVEITPAGLLSVVTACEGFRHVCDDDSSCDPIFCERQGGCHLRDPCTIPGMQPWHPAATKAVQFILFSTDPLKRRDQSPCICLDATKLSCPDAGVDAGTLECTTAGLNDLLRSKIPAGLSFSGFTDPDTALLAMAFFQAPGVDVLCSSMPNDGADLCVEANMVACAGLAQPIGGKSFNVTCASCQGGIHQPIGNDTGPCLTHRDECFLQTCAGALFPNGGP